MGLDDKIHKLMQGEPVQLHVTGNSMSGLIENDSMVWIDPIVQNSTVQAGDIVLCSVHGKKYLHLVTSAGGDRYEISNNHGHVNGWASRSEIYGILRRTIST